MSVVSYVGQFSSEQMFACWLAQDISNSLYAIIYETVVGELKFMACRITVAYGRLMSPIFNSTKLVIAYCITLLKLAAELLDIIFVWLQNVDLYSTVIWCVYTMKWCCINLHTTGRKYNI